MKRRLYSEEEIELLKKCKFVLDVKFGCQIDYDPIFKVWCIMMKFECPELTAKEIFDRAGMNTNLLHKQYQEEDLQIGYILIKDMV